MACVAFAFLARDAAAPEEEKQRRRKNQSPIFYSPVTCIYRSRPSIGDRKIPNETNNFFVAKHGGFLTTAHAGERSQTGRDRNGCGCRRVPTADEWSPSRQVAQDQRARAVVSGTQDSHGPGSGFADKDSLFSP